MKLKSLTISREFRTSLSQLPPSQHHQSSQRLPAPPNSTNAGIYPPQSRTPQAKKAMGDVGIMLELVKFLNSKSFEIREMATETLFGLVLVPKNRKRFVQDDHNIGLVLQLLDSEQENSVNKKLFFSILMSLTCSNSGRRKIVSSGYVKNIEKLAESEVSDVKKLVRKLSTNRFRSMITAIWHS